MSSFVAGVACATTSVFGSEVVPPGTGVVTVMARDPAVAMSEAGIDARSWLALTKVVSRGSTFVPLMLLEFTTALGANPPPFTVNVNAGPPVATMDGDIEVISMPEPDSGALWGEAGPSSATLMFEVSLPTTDGVNVTPTWQLENAGTANKAVPRQGFAVPPRAGASWKSPGFVPPLMVKPVELTLRATAVPFRRVAFSVKFEPMATPPKFTGVRITPENPAVKGVPVIGIICGLPEPLSVSFSVAVLTVLPGVKELAK
jgi:hypothetical protein